MTVHYNVERNRDYNDYSHYAYDLQSKFYSWTVSEFLNIISNFISIIYKIKK